MTQVQALQNRMALVEQRIADACKRAGRTPEDVQVIAVTKYVSLDTTRQAVAAGLRELGENRWQDAAAKWQALSGDAGLDEAEQPVWHFIGSLQTNKVKEVVGRFTFIHSLDRLSLAEAIHKRAVQLGIVVPCFIQVNVSGEESKHGLAPQQLHEFVQSIKSYAGIKPIGLMTMAPLEADDEQTRLVFRALRELRDELAQQSPDYADIRHLSMGMSGDFEIAIEEGATWVRLGTILVGKEEG
jgi:pyridoxal phosphate enzyme (YggS family)